MLVNTIDYTHLQLSHMHVKRGIQTQSMENNNNGDDTSGASKDNGNDVESDANKGKIITVIDVKKPLKLSKINEGCDDSGESDW